MNFFLASLMVDLLEAPWRCPRNLVGPGETFLVMPEPTLNLVNLFLVSHKTERFITECPYNAQSIVLITKLISI